MEQDEEEKVYYEGNSSMFPYENGKW